MRISMLKPSSLACLLPFVFFACSSAPEPLPLTTNQAGLAAQENVNSVVDELGASLSFLAKSEILDNVSSLVPFLNQSEVDCTPLDEGSSEFEEPCSPVEEGNLFEGVESSFDELGDDLAKFLADYLFVESQLESEDGFELIYKLDPALVCGEPDPQEEGDDGCTNFLTEYPVRVKIVSYNEGDLDISFLFGPEKHEGFRFEIHKVELAAEFDFGSALSVVKEVIEILNPDDPDASQMLPEILDGRIRVSLEALGAKTVQLKLAVVETFQLLISADQETLIDLSIAPSHGLVKANGTSEVLTVEVEVGAIDLTGPASIIGGGEVECGGMVQIPSEEPVPEDFEVVCEEPSPELDGTLTLHLGGFGLNFDLQADQDVLVLRNVGLGETTSSLLHNATQLLGIDLNPNSGRELEVTFFQNAAKNVVLELIPELDVHVNLTFGDTIEAFNMPEWMADDLIQVTLNGADVPSVEFVENGLAILEGHFAASSSAYPADEVTVQSGQCLVGKDEDETTSEDAHPMLGSLTAGQCESK